VWRGLMFFARYVLATRNMGLWGAFKVYVRSRWSWRIQSVNIKGIGEFWYRGGTDFGVMSHFYNEGYHIVDCADQPITRIIDGGANIGVETRRFAYFYPRAGIVAVEPEQGNYEILKRNTCRLPSILTLRAALWPHTARLTILPASTPEGFAVAEVEADSPNKCDAVTIPEILNMTGWTDIDILKLDIEGAEYELFGEEIQHWVGRVNCFIFECPDPAHPTATARIFASLPSVNYRTEICGECLVIMKQNMPWTLSRETLL
jgi:FkbM family methyltransferase